MRYEQFLQRDGEQVIEVQKIDGLTMYLNEELIERVENTLSGQCAIYLIHGGHMVVSHDSSLVAEKIREEKIIQFQKAFGLNNEMTSYKDKLREISIMRQGDFR